MDNQSLYKARREPSVVSVSRLLQTSRRTQVITSILYAIRTFCTHILPCILFLSAQGIGNYPRVGGGIAPDDHIVKVLTEPELPLSLYSVVLVVCVPSIVGASRVPSGCYRPAMRHHLSMFNCYKAFSLTHWSSFVPS